ncbi:ferrous iron transport protein B [Leptospira sp. 96542]|nr:ferrous iron transport protein B [Leptospira sp. 96542]
MNSQNILLVGNPNCGKTTLFNHLTGLNQKTGNFSGVTVEKKTGNFKVANSEIKITDLPGSYGLGGVAEDKKIAYEVLLERNPEDKVLYVLDSLNLERGLQFLLQIMDMGVAILVVLTMKDVLEKKQILIDTKKLEKTFGLNFLLINTKSGDGIQTIKQYIGDPGSFKKNNRLWSWDKKEEIFFNHAKQKLNIKSNETEFFLSQSLKYLNNDPHLNEERYLEYFPNETKEWLKEKLSKNSFRFFYEEEIIRRSIFIKQIITSSVLLPKNPTSNWERKLDAVLLHPIFGFFVFFGIMALLFQSLFNFAELPMEFIESGIELLQNSIGNYLDNGPLKSLLIEGMIGGVGSVIVFIPQIALLFLFIGILEETGYLARVSFLMDKIMGKFGLSGKSFIPLLSSAACAVPAILGTRTIENKSDRLTTIMVSPLIMCSARYPVYILIVGTVFSFSPIFGFINVQGFVLFCMFLIGLVFSFLFALLFRRTVFKETASYFVVELPRYMLPSLRSLFQTVYEKIKSFLATAGQIILYISIVLWFLSNFPANTEKNHWQPSSIEKSYIGQIGKTIEPVIRPMGFDWKIGISILTSFAAREVMVSTLAVLYGSDENEESENLRSTLRKDSYEDGTPVWTPLVGLSLLVFFAFASQCMSTLAVTKKETGSIVWPLLQFFYMTLLAIFSSLCIFQVGSLLGFN